MKKIIGIALLLLVLGYQQYQVFSLQVSFIQRDQALLSVFSRIDEEFNKLNDATIEREHALQDTLEERIGTLEHELDSLKFVKGRK